MIMSMSATIIACANQKGGVTKTTTCANLGVGLVKQGKKVLLVDFDPQGSLTISLGYPQPDELPITITQIMQNILLDKPFDPKEGILRHEEGVDLMPANIELSGMEVSLVNAMSRETVLKQYLDMVKKDYDYILLDCMPSLGMLTINALAASDSVLIPPLLDMVDAKKIAFNPAVELSHLNSEEQSRLLDTMESEQATPSLSQAQRLKKFSQEGKLTPEAMQAIMSEEKKPELDKLTIPSDKLRKFFPKSFTPQQMEQTILRLLEQWQRKRQQDMER